MNADEVLSMSECVYVGCRCDKCGTIEQGYGMDEYNFAEMLVNMGWHQTKSGNAVCKSCDRRKKR